MKKRLAAPFLLVVALAIICVDASAQGRANEGGRGTGGPFVVDAQIRRNNRLPGGQRGVNRPPLGDPQLGRKRAPGANQIKKQQLQQRVMQAIGLTSEQRTRMQEIRRGHEDEVIGAGRRLRQARQALDRAIMSEPYSESEVRKATDALAEAQADKIRLDARVRAQVRGVLTPEQVQRFHQLQRQMRREMIEEQRDQDRNQGPQGINNSPELEEFDLADLLLPVS